MPALQNLVMNDFYWQNGNRIQDTLQIYTPSTQMNCSNLVFMRNFSDENGLRWLSKNLNIDITLWNRVTVHGKMSAMY